LSFNCSKICIFSIIIILYSKDLWKYNLIICQQIYAEFAISCTGYKRNQIVCLQLTRNFKNPKQEILIRQVLLTRVKTSFLSNLFRPFILLGLFRPLPYFPEFDQCKNWGLSRDHFRYRIRYIFNTVFRKFFEKEQLSHFMNRFSKFCLVYRMKKVILCYFDYFVAHKCLKG
jgi:hypothetical protein